MKRTILVAILFATTTTGHAEPTPAVQHLMSESASLFDLGMFRLEQHLSNVKLDGVSSTSVRTRYWWDKNRIVISGLVRTHEAESVQSRKIRCKEVLEKIREFLHVEPRTGKPFFGSTNSSLGTLFSHIGFEGTDKSKNLAVELDAIVELSGWVYYEPEQAPMKCKSQLLSKEILFPE